MINFNENATVIYTDDKGRKIDTFVIFDTDQTTGLTHINHNNLRVPAANLVLHSKTVGLYHMPLADAFSFEMLRKLKEKYNKIDSLKKSMPIKSVMQTNTMYLLAKAS